jgi:hypothetical protein
MLDVFLIYNEHDRPEAEGLAGTLADRSESRRFPLTRGAAGVKYIFTRDGRGSGRRGQRPSGKSRFMSEVAPPDPSKPVEKAQERGYAERGDLGDGEGATPMDSLGYAIEGLIRAPFNLLMYVTVRLRLARTNRRSKASDPGLVRLSHARLKCLCPESYAIGFDPIAWFDRLLGERACRIFLVKDQLVHGDSRAAVVMSVSPLVVAAYSEELDSIAMLRFPDEWVRELDLRVGSRLLTVNRYVSEGGLARDLEYGPLSRRLYTNFYPLVADLMSDDTERLRLRKAEISEDEWARTWVLGWRYLERHGTRARDGHPSLSATPAAVNGADRRPPAAFTLPTFDAISEEMQRRREEAALAPPAPIPQRWRLLTLALVTGPCVTFFLKFNPWCPAPWTDIPALLVWMTLISIFVFVMLPPLMAEQRRRRWPVEAPRPPGPPPKKSAIWDNELDG